MNPPDFTLDKIKFSADPSAFKKALDLYRKDTCFSWGKPLLELLKEK